jgi:hypothetical protein
LVTPHDADGQVIQITARDPADALPDPADALPEAPSRWPGRYYPRCGNLDLREFAVELADLVLSPDRRTESVMRDRCHHEESGLSCVEALVDPVCVLHAGLQVSQGTA